MGDFQRGQPIVGTDFFPELASTPLSLNTADSTKDVRRMMRYSHFWDYYTGKHWKKERIDGEPQITANFCQGFVNKSASFLMSKGWTIKDKDSVDSKENIEFINKVWNNVEKEIISYELAQGGGIFGDAVLTILPDNNGLLSLDLVPPLFVTPIFHPANINLIMAIKIEFPLDEQRKDSMGSVLTTIIDSMTVRQWIDKTQVYFKEHGLGEIPAVWFKNKLLTGTKYGVSDLNVITPLNKLYNEKLTDISDIINYHASPVTLAYGIKIKKLEKGARKMWGGLPSPKDAKIENLEMKNDLGAADNHLNSIQRLMHQLSDIPEIAFGTRMEVSNTSGIAIQLLFKPLTDLTTVKYITYGSGLRRANRIITKYGIKFGYLAKPRIYNLFDLAEYYRTDISWPSPLPMDELLHLNMIINKLKSGTITVADALSELGVSNVKRYIEQISEDVSSGTNYLLSAALAKGSSKFLNLGGVMRDQNTPIQPAEVAA